MTDEVYDWTGENYVLTCGVYVLTGEVYVLMGEVYVFTDHVNVLTSESCVLRGELNNWTRKVSGWTSEVCKAEVCDWTDKLMLARCACLSGVFAETYQFHLEQLNTHVFGRVYSHYPMLTPY